MAVKLQKLIPVGAFGETDSGYCQSEQIPIQKNRGTMINSSRTALSTTVDVKTKLYVQNYAKQNDLSLSTALDRLINKIVKSEPMVTVNMNTTVEDLAEIKDELKEMNTMLRYLSLKIENLPCNNSI